jgi:predicted glycosyltransferase
MEKILFVSGSLGLGHVLRDLAIARELRKTLGEIDIQWLAAEPASTILIQAGETLVPETDLLINDTAQAEKVAGEGKLNLLSYAFNALRAWLHNADVVKQILRNRKYDLMIGDETYEIGMALILKRLKLKIPFVMLYDFFGLDAMTNNPFEKIGMFIWNRIWSLDYTIFKQEKKVALFIGEQEDIPDTKLGFLLSNRREYAKNHYEFVGYILPFKPEEFTDKGKLRKSLGYGDNPLVICSIGGTSVGGELLKMCSKAFRIARKKIPDLNMVLVCGPRLSSESLDIPKEDGLDVRQYVPDLYKHFAACDLAIVQAGGTTTLELTALQKEFIYFPIEGHSEQEIVVSSRLERHKAGIKMSYSNSNENILAEAIANNINNTVEYKQVPISGAHNVVQFVRKLLYSS